jgi:hypothetical protein
MQDDRCPLSDPHPGDIVEATIGVEVIVRLVTMVVEDTIRLVIFDTFQEGKLYSSDKLSIFSWQAWCEDNDAIIIQLGDHE